MPTEELLPVAFAGLLGLILGSFYTVCIQRYLLGGSIVGPRSHCPQCGKPLAPWELVPLLSWLALRGRCAGCRQPIDSLYPAVELASGLWAALLALRFGLLTPPWLAHMAVGGLLIVASGIDLKAYILPDMLTKPGIVLAGCLSVTLLDLTPLDMALGAVTGGGVFQALRLGYRWLRGREGLGGGDVKLMVLLGAWLGWQALPQVLLLASLTAIPLAIVQTFSSGSGDDQDPPIIPFGPFLSLGAMLHVLLGPDILTTLLARLLA